LGCFGQGKSGTYFGHICPHTHAYSCLANKLLLSCEALRCDKESKSRAKAFVTFLRLTPSSISVRGTVEGFGVWRWSMECVSGCEAGQPQRQMPSHCARACSWGIQIQRPSAGTRLCPKTMCAPPLLPQPDCCHSGLSRALCPDFQIQVPFYKMWLPILSPCPIPVACTVATNPLLHLVRLIHE
jgi:hypothetical protein